MIRTRSRPWHRALDPGVETGDDEATEGNIEAITQTLALYAALKQTFDGDTPGEVQARQIIDDSTALILQIVPLQPDRPDRGGGIDGGGGDFTGQRRS